MLAHQRRLLKLVKLPFGLIVFRCVFRFFSLGRSHIAFGTFTWDLNYWYGIWSVYDLYVMTTKIQSWDLKSLAAVSYCSSFKTICSSRLAECFFAFSYSMFETFRADFVISLPWNSRSCMIKQYEALNISVENGTENKNSVGTHLNHRKPSHKVWSFSNNRPTLPWFYEIRFRKATLILLPSWTKNLKCRLADL